MVIVIEVVVIVVGGDSCYNPTNWWVTCSYRGCGDSCDDVVVMAVITRLTGGEVVVIVVVM